MARTIAMLVAVALLNATTAAYAAPVCGDVNDSGGVNTSDALLVLRDAVGQPVSLPCAGYTGEIAVCQNALSTTNADLATCNSALGTCQTSTCGNNTAEYGELCDGTDLHGKTCATEVPSTPYGALSCAVGCGAFDTGTCVARFDASGATIIDHATGLEWEKKTGTAGALNVCPGPLTCIDVHEVSNAYSWGSTSPPYAPTGNAYVDFLAKLNSNDDLDGGPGVCYAGHCDWRLPTIEELLGIVDLSAAGCGFLHACLPSVFLPDAASSYWSATSSGNGNGYNARVLFTDSGNAYSRLKTEPFYVRAVRAAW